MLASSFLSPDRLALTIEEHAAAICVLGVFERGEVRHIHFRGLLAAEPIRGARFNVTTFARCDQFGTCCCFAGWMAREMRMPFDVGWRWMEGHRSLAFRDLTMGRIRDDITVGQMAAAARNFLTLNNPLWETVL